ncbi:hypothetical protein WMY93_028363 [Mugilogobius chulae]|uniref:RRM domain-containing protein n=1 Tax=Mugilogobius chulae TaxID=88201 RepID=A0AAW0MZ38_9GOBI
MSTATELQHAQALLREVVFGARKCGGAGQRHEHFSFSCECLSSASRERGSCQAQRCARTSTEDIEAFPAAQIIPKCAGNLPETCGVEYVEMLCSLIKLSADAKDIEDLTAKLPKALHSTDSLERWRLVDVIAEKLSESPEQSERWRKSVIAAALVCLKASYSQFKDPDTSRSQQEQSVLDTWKRLLTSADDISASEWNSFVKAGLKHRYKHAHFLTSLSSLVEVMYRQTEPHTDLLPLATVHMMSSSHSMFLPCMLDSSEEQAGSLVSLLLCLVRKCPSVCNISHFVVLLGAYEASLSSLDQKLLLLIQEYEKNNVSLLKFQSFMWGPAAVEHHKAKKSLGSSLWKQTSTEELLALLKPERMIQSIALFPQQRKLIPQSVIDCLKFVSCHALGFTAMALSSYDPKMRAAAYHVLTCFYRHLEGARFKEKKQLLYLVDILKNSVRQQNQRIPFILTTYISKVLQIMLKPEDHMYMVLNRFLLSHQSLDFRRVPEFFKLFYGFDLEHKLERDWILNVLEEGISDRYCYELCEQQGVFQSVLGFCSSPLCDEATQAQILRVLCHAAKVTQAAYNLTKSCGLLSWIIQLLDKRKCDQQQLGAIIELVHSLWTTNLGRRRTEEKPVKAVKCLPLPLTCEFVSVASTISKHLRLGVKASHFSMFLQTYSSVLKHYLASLDMSAQAERFTLLPEPLSCSEALSLLHCWATLRRDSQLLNHIHSVCQQHQLRQLLTTAKDKNHKVKAFGSRSLPSGEAFPDKTEDRPLDESPLALCAVFCHWTPVVSFSQGQTTQPGDKMEPSALAKDTALLLTKWSLRSLLESSYTQQKTKDFLHWLDTAVLKHEQIVEALLLDAQLKADLLRLYHQAFENQHAGLFLCSLYIHELWSGVTSAELFMTHIHLVTKDAPKKKKGTALSASSTQTHVDFEVHARTYDLDEYQALFYIKSRLFAWEEVNMDAVNAFSAELYKHVVQLVEKFVKKCKPELKVPGLYVVDSIVRQSRHQFGVDKDVFGPRFLKNFTETFHNIYCCPEEDKTKIMRVLNLWQKNGVFDMDIIQPLMDMAHGTVKTGAGGVFQAVNMEPHISGMAAASDSVPAEPQMSNIEALAVMAQLFQSPEGQELQRVLQNLQQGNETLAAAIENKLANPTEVSAAHPSAYNPHNNTLAEKLLDRFEYEDEPEEKAPIQNHAQLLSIAENVLKQFAGQLPDAQEVQPHLMVPHEGSSLNQEAIHRETDSAYTAVNEPYTREPLRDDSPVRRDSRRRSYGRRSRSRSRSPHRRRSRSSSRSRRSRHRRTRSKSKERPKRSRSMERSEREKERERRQRGLPSIKSQTLSVCTTTLWVGQLDKKTQQADIELLLEEFGQIESVNMIPPRGCAYIVMIHRQDANTALNKLSRGIYRVNQKPFKIAWALNKGIKSAHKKLWDVDHGVTYIPWNKSRWRNWTATEKEA